MKWIGNFIRHWLAILLLGMMLVMAWDLAVGLRLAEWLGRLADKIAPHKPEVGE